MDDRDFVAGMATRAGGPLPPRPGFLLAMKLKSSFVGEIEGVDAKQILNVFAIATAEPGQAGDAPVVRMAIHRMPSGDVAVVVGAADDPTDKTAEWAPFDPKRASAMVAGLRCRAALEGRDLEALANSMSNLSWFAHEAPFVATFDCGRVAVMANGQGILVLTAKARFGPV